jgi:hypothetical protein
MLLAPVGFICSAAGGPELAWPAISESLIQRANYSAPSHPSRRLPTDSLRRYVEHVTKNNPDGVPSVDDQFDAAATDRAERAERAATLRLTTIEAGRRKGGIAGAAMAGAMLAVQEIYEGPPLDTDIVEVAESPNEPGDIDTDGIEVTVGGVDVWAPPPGGASGTETT